MAKTSKTVPQKEKAFFFFFSAAVAWMSHAVPDLEDWVRKLAATSSHAERCWRDLARGRWEAKNHGLGDVAELRPTPLGEEVVPKSAKDKKKRRDPPSNTPEPKKSRARKPKDDSAALSSSVAQKLQDEEEEREDAGCELMPRKRGNIEASKAAGPVTVDETHPRTEEISEGCGASFPETFSKYQAELNRCEAELKKLTEERDALKCLYVKKEEDTRDLRADLAQAHKEEAELDTQVTILLKEYGLDSTMEANTSISQLQQKLEMIELLRWEVYQVKADCDRWNKNVDRLATEKEAALPKFSSAEVQLQGVKEKISAQAKRIEELKAELAEAKAEVGKTKISAGKSIAMYLANGKASQAQLREASVRELRSNDLARCQSHRETLEEIHARGFDLFEEIAQANALEADARLLVSSDDDDEGQRLHWLAI
ncbi:uncharacterized protein [Nicotiana sylvestris]|uniref:uncharacterized protein n=1 Tax=Nicotiana sylvestris TaxID=4096 RepID=UPI00388CD0EE